MTLDTLLSRKKSQPMRLVIAVLSLIVVACLLFWSLPYLPTCAEFLWPTCYL